MMIYPVREPADPETVWQRCMEQGEAAKRHGRFAEAEERYRDALSLADGFGPGDTRVAESLTALGLLLSRTSAVQNDEEAEWLLQQVVRLRGSLGVTAPALQVCGSYPDDRKRWLRF